MLIKEISSAFLTKYKRISYQRDLKVQDLNKAEIALMISEAQNDIQGRIDVIIGTKAITLVSGTNLYNCPNDFGRLKFAMLGDNLVEVESERELFTSYSLDGTPVKCAVYTAGNTPQILVYPTPTDTATLNIYYSIDTNYYQPSSPTDQVWGDFSGTEFSGKLLLPDKYDRAVNLFLLAQFFEDYEAKYDKEILSLKCQQAAGLPLRLKYQFGTPRKNQAFVAGTGTTMIATTTNKIYQVLIAQTGTSDPIITNTFVNGLSGTPVFARTGVGIYTITLASAFTLNKTFIHKPNIDMAIVGDEVNAELEHTSVDVITLRVFDSVNEYTDGFNAIWIKVEVEP